MDDSDTQPLSSSFPPTEWTRVIEVIQGGDHDTAQVALSQFCERYRPAIYGFFRRRGCNHDQADEHTQVFFLKRIHTRWDTGEGFLFKARKDRDRRFRSFLCHVLWQFLREQRKAARTWKRGRGLGHVPLDGLDFPDAEGEAKAFAEISADLDREVALTILRTAAGNSPRDQALLKYFRVQGATSQVEAAKELGISEENFRQRFYHFRKRFNQRLRQEVSKLVGPDPKDIDAELQYLISVFARSDP